MVVMKANRNGFTTLDEAISGEVRAEMARLKISQSDVAAGTSMHPNVFGRKWRGEVAFSLTELGAVADYLGVDLVELTAGARKHVTKEVA